VHSAAVMAAALDRRDIVKALLGKSGRSPWDVARCYVCVYCGGSDSVGCRLPSHTAFRGEGPATASIAHAASCCGNVPLLAWLLEHFPPTETQLLDGARTEDEVWVWVWVWCRVGVRGLLRSVVVVVWCAARQHAPSRCQFQ
jgi:hypothetical protein